MLNVLQFWKSKTLTFGYALTVAGAVYDNFEAVSALIPDASQGKAYSLLGLVVIALRAATSQPLSAKSRSK